MAEVLSEEEFIDGQTNVDDHYIDEEYEQMEHIVPQQNDIISLSSGTSSGSDTIIIGTPKSVLKDTVPSLALDDTMDYTNEDSQSQFEGVFLGESELELTNKDGYLMFKKDRHWKKYNSVNPIIGNIVDDLTFVTFCSCDKYLQTKPTNVSDK